MIEQTIFIIHTDQVQLAGQIIEEVHSFGGDIGPLNFASRTEIPPRNVFERMQPGFRDFRRVARQKVLEAHNVEPDETRVSSQLVKMRDELFPNRTGTIDWVVWKDEWNKVKALGEMAYMEGLPAYQELIALGRSGREWQEVACWNLGNPDFRLDPNNQYFKRVLPEVPHFLFNDEMESLRKDGQIVTYQSHDIYNEEFEAYLINKAPKYSYPTLFKIRARLTD